MRRSTSYIWHISIGLLKESVETKLRGVSKYVMSVKNRWRVKQACLLSAVGYLAAPRLLPSSLPTIAFIYNVPCHAIDKAVETLDKHGRRRATLGTLNRHYSSKWPLRANAKENSAHTAIINDQKLFMTYYYSTRHDIVMCLLYLGKFFWTACVLSTFFFLSCFLACIFIFEHCTWLFLPLSYKWVCMQISEIKRKNNSYLIRDMFGERVAFNWIIIIGLGFYNAS